MLFLGSKNNSISRFYFFFGVSKYREEKIDQLISMIQINRDLVEYNV